MKKTNLRSMSNNDFFKTYEEIKGNYEMWQREYEARMSVVDYDKSKMKEILQLLEHIFCTNYSNQTLECEENTVQYLNSFCFSGGKEFARDILLALNKLAIATDGKGIDSDLIESAYDTLPF